MKISLTKAARTALCYFAVSFVMMSLSSSALAVNWKIPDNIRIVQKDNVDNTRTFSSIQAAIDSITNASDTNRYTVKIMPGVYLETVTMKDYVDLDGSGSGSTVIKSSIVSTSMMGTSCDRDATLTGANHAAIKNIRIINNGSTLNAKSIALRINGVDADIENAIVEAIGVLGEDGENVALCIGDYASNISVRNVKIKVEGSREVIGIVDWGLNVDINNTQCKASTTGISSWASCYYRGYTGTYIRNSVFEATNAQSANGMTNVGNVSITDSKIIASNGADTVSIMGFQGSIANSAIIAQSPIGRTIALYGGRAASSMIVGAVINGGKLVNCWNENFEPIPNQ